MTEPNPCEPPLVLRPEPSAVPGSGVGPAPKRPRPGFWEAAFWCAVFLTGQVFGVIVGTAAVFGTQAIRSPDPGAFLTEQFDGFLGTMKPNPDGGPNHVPAEFGRALAWGVLTAQGVSLGLVVLVLPRRIGPDWKRQIGVRAPAKLHLLLVLLVVPGFMIGADAVQAGFNWLTGVSPQSTTRVIKEIFGPFGWPLTALAVAIGPGVVEEFWCRGFLGRGLSARYGLGVGVLFTSLMFALMHGDVAQLLVYTLMGAYLHFVYLTTRSIWPPILLHASNNGLGVLLMLGLSPEQLAEFPTPIGYLCAGSLLLFGSIALWTGRAEAQPLPGAPIESDWKPEYPGISIPPPGAGVRLGTAAVSPAAVAFAIVSFGVLIYLGCLALI
jgi:membrane protease YdiL (CAAX protease family)